MLHLIKLAVGIRDVGHLAAVQPLRTEADGHVRHITRQTPKRDQALLDGGSLYWVIGGLVLARQNLAGIERVVRSDGVPAAALVLNTVLIRTAAQPVRAFQGWRYLRPEDAPPDLAATDSPDLPDALRAALRALALV